MFKNPPDVIKGVLGGSVDCHYEKSTPKLTTASSHDGIDRTKTAKLL